MERFSILVGDITQSDAEAIVNAANPTLLGGAGVDGAIHAAAGPELLAECRTLGGCERGQAKLTRGYRLRAKYVLHTPGPIWRGGDHGEAAVLASCYRSCLELAADHGIRTLDFCSISTGVYGYPLPLAATVALRAIMDFLADHPLPERVRMVCHTETGGGGLPPDLEPLVRGGQGASGCKRRRGGESSPPRRLSLFVSFVTFFDSFCIRFVLTFPGPSRMIESKRDERKVPAMRRTDSPAAGLLPAAHRLRRGRHGAARDAAGAPDHGGTAAPAPAGDLDPRPDAGAAGLPGAGGRRSPKRRRRPRKSRRRSRSAAAPAGGGPHPPHGGPDL